MARYTPGLRAAADEPGTIGVYGVIGESWDGSGWTSARMAGALRSIGQKDVTVLINSPGGDLFEGLAMYEQLRHHPGAVTVRILGLAASAASIVAMAGDRIEVAPTSSIMVHNTQADVAGDRNDMRAMADFLGPYDALLADIYAERTGKPAADITPMLDAATWFVGGKAVVDAGFADAVTEVETVTDPGARNSVRAVEDRLRAAGLSRTQAQATIADIKRSLSDSGTAAPLSESGSARTPSVAAEVLEYLRKRGNTQ